MLTKKENADPILVVYRSEKHESKLVTVLGKEFGRREYESPTIYFNSDRSYKLVVRTPDVTVEIRGGMGSRGENIQRSWVFVNSNLMPEDRMKTNRRLSLIGFDSTHGDGATIEAFGVRYHEEFLPSDFNKDAEKLFRKEAKQ